MATLQTPTSAPSWRPDVRELLPSDAVPDALVLRCTTVAGSVDGDAVAVRVPFALDDEADFIAEGEAIPEGEPDLAEITVFTGKISQLLRVSAEQWHQPDAERLLAESIGRAVVTRANLAFIRQDAPTPPAVAPAAGLLSVGDILDGGEVGDDLDNLVDLLAEIEGNGGDPSHLLLSPTAWAALRKVKTAAGAATSLLGAGTNDAERRLLGVPVIVTPAVPAGTGIALDRRAIVSAVGPVRVATSEDAYFASDSIGTRCTWRVGSTVARPDRLGSFTVAGAVSEPGDDNGGDDTGGDDTGGDDDA